MKKGFVLLIAMLFTSNIFCTTQPNIYNELVAKASSLPTFRDLYNQGKISLYPEPGSLLDKDEYMLYKIVTCYEFESTLDRFFSVMSDQLKNKNAWLNPSDEMEHFTQAESFVPYAQKMVVDPGTHLICKGDLHGDLHSLLAFLKSLQEKNITDKEDGLKIIDPSYRLIFHGDYVDRGLWGVEVVYLLMLLKINNPDQVFLIRGNHEDPEIAMQYGFAREFHAKFSPDYSKEDLARCYRKMSRFYNYLPLVCYAGSGNHEKRNFLQLCHGGIELGYNAKSFLGSSDDKTFHYIEMLERLSHCCKLPSHSILVQSTGEKVTLQSFCKNFKALTPMHPYPIGFLWHDFVVDAESLSIYKMGRGLQCNKDLTEDYLRASSTDSNILFGIIRAHQHMPDNNDPMMSLLFRSHGCAALWQQQTNDIIVKEGMVLTLLLSPDSLHGTPNLGGLPYTGFDYDTYAIVTAGEDLAQWNIKVVNTEVYKPQTAAAA